MSGPLGGFGVGMLATSAIFGFGMTYGIGANDVANSIGTAVGSKVMTIKQAIIMAGIAEFAGAALLGAEVANTLQQDLVNAEDWQGEAGLLMIGFTSALLGCALWLLVASKFGWPVSTTHSIVGCVFAFALAEKGPDTINWDQMLKILISWFSSPVMGGIIALFVYKLVDILILTREDVREAGFRWLWLFYLICSSVLSMFLCEKAVGKMSDPFLEKWMYWPVSAAFGIAAAIAIQLRIQRYKNVDGMHRKLVEGEGRLNSDALPSGSSDEESGVELFKVLHRDEKVEADPECEHIKFGFVLLQIFSAALVAFAHGANDVSNSIGPFAAVLSLYNTGKAGETETVALWVLAIGGVGIVLGLATLGYHVVNTVGTKLTKVTAINGFAMLFGTALTVLIATAIGVPVSTTHTLVGSVTGVGLGRSGRGGVNLGLLKKIMLSWVVTIPAAAAPCLVLFFTLKAALDVPGGVEDVPPMVPPM